MVFNKKALLSAFLFASFSVQPAPPPADCRLPGLGEPATIAAVSDGDTVRLQDGRRVRLLAFGALEINYEHPEQSAALALEAKKRLQFLLQKGAAVTLLSDKEKYDVHGRTLAQIIRADGLDVAQSQLERGLAHVYIFPPNDSLWHCYQRYENVARAKQVGLWALPEFQLRPVSSLSKGQSAYQLMQGKVSGYRKRSGAITVVLDERVFVHIRADNASLFSGQWRLPAVGEPLALRGILNWKKGQGHVDLRHPQALEKIPAG